MSAISKSKKKAHISLKIFMLTSRHESSLVVCYRQSRNNWKCTLKASFNIASVCESWDPVMKLRLGLKSEFWADRFHQKCFGWLFEKNSRWIRKNFEGWDWIIKRNEINQIKSELNMEMEISWFWIFNDLLNLGKEIKTEKNV